MNVLEDFLSGTDKTARKVDNDKYIASLMTRVDRINKLEASMEELGDDELTGKSAEFRKRLKMGEDINGPILEEAFAVVREAAWYVTLM
jgi:preprotein translocase subunit SecA